MGWAWTWVRCGQFPGLATLTTGESFGLIQVGGAGMGILDASMESYLPGQDPRERFSQRGRECGR